MGSIRNHTLYDWAHYGFGVTIACGCGHRVNVAAAQLVTRFAGRRAAGGLAHGQWEHRLKCSACGRRRPAIRCSYEPR